MAPDGNTAGVATCETSSPWVVNATSFPTQAAYQTTSSYDSVGELVSTTLPATTAAPSGITTSYTYDDQGNKLTSTDEIGVITTYTYTPMNLVASISYSGSSAHSVSYTYDADGNKTAMTDASGSSSYVYDPFGELTSAENGASQTVAYGYNADGEVTGITYPLPGACHLGHHGHCRLWLRQRGLVDLGDGLQQQDHLDLEHRRRSPVLRDARFLGRLDRDHLRPDRFSVGDRPQERLDHPARVLVLRRALRGDPRRDRHAELSAVAGRLHLRLAKPRDLDDSRIGLDALLRLRRLGKLDDAPDRCHREPTTTPAS